jgi:phosphate transport system protein
LPVVFDSFRAFGRRLVMQMTEAPRTIPVGLEYMFIAKALSVSGTTRGIDALFGFLNAAYPGAEKLVDLFVVYVVKGRDVRHVPLDRLDEEVLAN